MATEDRAALLVEAESLDRVGGQWGVAHVRVALGGVSRSTLYATPWIMALAKTVPGLRGPRWWPAEVRRALALNTERRAWKRGAA